MQGELTDALLCPKNGEAIIYANLPMPPYDVTTRDEEELLEYVNREHNASLFTITNQRWYGLVACKDIPAGQPLAVHYGPASGHLLRFASNRYNRA